MRCGPNTACSLRRAATLLSLIPVLPVTAQAPTAAERAQVLVLGTYHFANPGLDVVQIEVADVLAPEKQAEILEVIEALAPFRPTKIAVEAPRAMAPALDSLYHSYRSGKHELSRNEVQQLGFRLAARFDHPSVYPIDHEGEFPFGALMEYAEAHEPAYAQYIQQAIADISAEEHRRQRELSIGQNLRVRNDPKTLAEEHGIYVRMAHVGASDTYVGADLLAKWYERSIGIFAHLQRIAEPGDRILVIIGSGHAPILRELISHDPELLLVEALQYLRGRTNP